MNTEKTYPHTEAQRSTGDWNPIWDQLFEMDPDYLEAFLHFRSVPQTNGPLEQKYKEMIFIAINAATYWHALRAMGINDQFAGHGPLFEKH